MDPRASAAVRCLRALVLGLVVVGFGSVAHALAGGNLPGVAGLTVVTGLSVLVAAALLERPASTAFLVTLTVTGQALVHAWLTLTSGHGGSHGAAGDPLGHLLADLTPANAPMLLAHVLAAAGVGLWLAAGERALWALLALAAGAFVVLLERGLPPATSPRPRPVVTPQRPPALRLLVRSLVRRGPPVLLTA